MAANVVFLPAASTNRSISCILGLSVEIYEVKWFRFEVSDELEFLPVMRTADKGRVQ